MRIKALLTAGAIVALAIPAGADAASSRDKAVGGGQTFFSTSDTGNSAGDTIAFQAQRKRGEDDGSNVATGQIQVNRRTTDAVKFHGIIECLVVRGERSLGSAYMSGESRSGVPFELYVTDAGRGQQEQGADMIALFVDDEIGDNNGSTANDDAFCGFGETPKGSVLGRGNVQTWNNNTSEDGSNAPPAAPQQAGALAGALSLL